MDDIRQAAKLMRERAKAASPGPWISWLEGRDHRGGDSFIQTSGEYDITTSLAVLSDQRGWIKEWEADQDHIASWHPTVALAVADWLDSFEARLDDKEYEATDWNAAVQIARAYLGKGSDSGPGRQET